MLVFRLCFCLLEMIIEDGVNALSSMKTRLMLYCSLLVLTLIL